MSQTFETFGKYILLEKLATGGMAEVYLAKNVGADGIGKFIAVKRILPQYSENPEFIDMFKDEAKIAVNLAHNNIVSIHEFGVEKSAFFLVMDYVEGRNLRQILNKMKKSGLSFSIEQVLYIIKEVAAGLDSAHRCLDRSSGKPLNITHRDMSPQNVMISFEGEVKVVDFGIAKAETQIETTRAGTLKGKFGYMSPEQAEGQVVDLRTDIFSLGIVLWELLANDRLFVANNEINTLRKIRDCQIPSLRKINPNIPTELERICNKALARDRNLRYQTSAAFHRELSRFLNRQFPDFSPHDFSVFIKTLFAAEILDHRKKIVEYSRVDAAGMLQPAAGSAPGPEPRAQDRTQATQSTAATGTEHDQEPTQQTASEAYLDDNYFGNPKTKGKPASKVSPVEPVAKPAAKPASKSATKPLNPKNPLSGDADEYRKLRVDPASKPPGMGSHEGSFANHTVAGYTTTRARAYGGYTGTNTRIQRNDFKRNVRNAALGVVVLTALVGSAFYAAKPVEMTELIKKVAKVIWPNWDRPARPIDEPCLPGQPGCAESASTTKLTIWVTSSPPNAEVWVDGTLQRETTPAKVQVEPDRDYFIVIHKDQYANVEVRRRFTRDGERISAKLSIARVAFVDVIVEGNGEIYIDQKRVATRGPLKGYQIPANQDVIIRAYDPATGAQAIERVRLGEGFQKQVKLYPKVMPPSMNIEAVPDRGLTQEPGATQPYRRQ